MNTDKCLLCPTCKNKTRIKPGPLLHNAIKPSLYHNGLIRALWHYSILFAVINKFDFSLELKPKSLFFMAVYHPSGRQT